MKRKKEIRILEEEGRNRKNKEGEREEGDKKEERNSRR